MPEVSFTRETLGPFLGLKQSPGGRAGAVLMQGLQLLTVLNKINTTFLQAFLYFIHMILRQK